MEDSETPEVLDVIIRRYFSQARTEEEAIQARNHLRRALHEVMPALLKISIKLIYKCMSKTDLLTGPLRCIFKTY